LKSKGKSRQAIRQRQLSELNTGLRMQEKIAYHADSSTLPESRTERENGYPERICRDERVQAEVRPARPLSAAYGIGGPLFLSKSGAFKALRALQSAQASAQCQQGRLRILALREAVAARFTSGSEPAA
jgi:hypothetical protein